MTTYAKDTSRGQRTRLAVFVATLTLAFISCRPSPPPNSSATLEHEFDVLVPSLLKQQSVPGVSIAVIQDGKVSWAKSYGLADKAKGARMRTETRFNVGSVSKTVTAWAVMTLVEKGLVRLDAPVDSYLKRWHLPQSAFDNNKVTVRRLLTHTAGLSIYPAGITVDPQGLYQAGEKLPPLETALSRSRGSYGALRVVEEPGERFQYNNGDYVVLQLLVEDVTSESFAAYVERVIFKPLAMNSTGYDWTSELQSDVATPYNANGEALPHYLGPEYGSGGVFTTASDLARFVAAAMISADGASPGREILKPETVTGMLQPVAQTNDAYGYGYKMFPVSKDLRLVSHDGANEGWRAMFLMHPEKPSGIVILTNSDAGGKIVAPIVCTWAERVSIDMSELCRSVNR